MTARLLTTMADHLSADNGICRLLRHWPGDPGSDALPLRLAGAFHALVLKGDAPGLAAIYEQEIEASSGEPNLIPWPLLRETMDIHHDDIAHFLQSPPQTNEVSRSAAFAAGVLTLGQLTGKPIVLFEIGASAGLNLHLDAYRYRLGDLTIGPRTSPLTLAPTWTGPAPPDGAIDIHHREGCDLRPIDPTSQKAVMRLRAYVWPDQPERCRRLDAALDIAAASTVRVEEAAAETWTEHKLSKPRWGLTRLLCHSIMWQYLPPSSRDRIEDAIRSAGQSSNKESPLAWLRLEPGERQAATLTLTLWPGERTWILADTDFHGRWIDWHHPPSTFKDMPLPTTI